MDLKNWFISGSWIRSAWLTFSAVKPRHQIGSTRSKIQRSWVRRNIQQRNRLGQSTTQQVFINDYWRQAITLVLMVCICESGRIGLWQTCLPFRTLAFGYGIKHFMGIRNYARAQSSQTELLGLRAYLSRTQTKVCHHTTRSKRPRPLCLFT